MEKSKPEKKDSEEDEEKICYVNEEGELVCE